MTVSRRLRRPVDMRVWRAPILVGAAAAAGLAAPLLLDGWLPKLFVCLGLTTPLATFCYFAFRRRASRID